VDSFNDRALTVYERLGFEAVEGQAVSDGGTSNAEYVLMRREESVD